MLDSIRHASGVFRREAIVGDTLDFAEPVTFQEIPEGSAVPLHSSLTIATLDRPGVYQVQGGFGLIEVFCFPAHSLEHPQLQVNNRQQPRPETERRLILRSVVIHADANAARWILPRHHWALEELVASGRAGENLSLQPYGGVNRVS